MYFAPISDMRSNVFSQSPFERAAKIASAVFEPIFGTDISASRDASNTASGEPNASNRRIAVIEPISGIEHNFIYDFQSSTFVFPDVLLSFYH